VLTLIQFAKLTAFAEHPTPAVLMANLAPVAPEAGTTAPAADNWNEHSTPAWFTVYVCPASVSVPVLGAAWLFAAAVNCTSPVPLLPELFIVSHGVVVDDVHVQPCAVVTVTDPEPPDAGTPAIPDDSTKLHTVPDCVMLTELPPIRTLAVRAFTEPLAAAVMLTLPGPVTLPNADTVSHDALLLADHTHAGLLVATPIAPVLPDAAKGLPSPDRSRLRSHAWPACVIWNRCPPIDSVPLREVVVAFGLTSMYTVPLGPLPAAPDVIVIQSGPVTEL